MRKLALASMLALIVTPFASAAFSGDVIFAGATNWNGGLLGAIGDRGRGSEIALAPVNFNAGFEFVGGDPNYDGGNTVGLGSSELLGDADSQWGGSWGTRNVTAMSRAIVNYDGDSFLELAAGKWGNHDNVWLTQVEYAAGASIENALFATTAGFGAWIDQSNAAVPNSGGQLSGKLRLGTDLGYRLGADPRFMVDVGGATFGMLGSEDVWAMAADASGDLFIAGRNPTLFAGQIVKVAAPGTLANAAGSRIGDVAGTPSLFYSSAYGWYTGVVESQGVLLAIDRSLQNIDAIDATTGALLGQYAMGTELSVAPEDLAILAEGDGTVRVVVNVLAADWETNPTPVKLAVLDMDLSNMAASSCVNLLTSGGLVETGPGAALELVDGVYVSPEGDIITLDSRPNKNDARWAGISTDALAAALTGDGSVVNVGTTLDYMWASYAGFNYARGLAFTPEPASLAMLVMGGLALIRRRK